MTNADIASVFTKISKILALKGENAFRVNAYDRAALTVSTLPRELESLFEEKGSEGLMEIPGIGKDLAQKIEELLKTGKLQFLKSLEKEVPSGLLDVMEVPGMGPKRTKQLFDKFKIKNLDDLEKLAESKKLSKLSGWGEKSAANVIQGIQIKRLTGLRSVLPVALPLAENILRALKATKLCVNAEIAGSLRRRKETIGDIDILVTSEEPKKVMDVFCSLPEVEQIIAKGETKSAVRLKAGLNADLRVVDPDVYGAALYYFTGSKEHNVHLRTIAVKRGITISEYGVFQGTAEKKGKMLAGSTEEEVFGSLGLPFIPPELREDRGEVEAAIKGDLPELIELKDIQGDLHVHSDFSDGAATMLEMARAAKEAGLKYIAFTDHASPMGMVRGIKEDNIATYLANIDKVRKAVPGIQILAGTEVDIKDDGSLYLSDEILSQLDWVVAAVHQKFSMSRKDMTQRIITAIQNPYVRVLAHPLARLLGKRPSIEFDEEEVFRIAKEKGVAVELNASIFRLDLDDIRCKRAKEIGVKIVMGSDAHHPSEFDYRFGISQARRGWLEKQDVINTLPWPEFEEKWLKRNKA